MTEENCVDNDGKSMIMVITAQVDINLIVISERIMKLQPAKKMNLMMIMMNESFGGWCRSLTLFWRSLSRHIIIFCIIFQK